MKVKVNIKRELKIGAAIAVLFFFIAFSERKQGTVAVKDIIIKVENVQENYFLDEDDIVELMKLDKENLKGATLDRLNMKSLENKIKAHRFVEDAELYSDLKGNLIVKATLRRPIARIVRNDGPDGYIAEDGTVMPVTEKYTARVMLLSGAFARQLLQVRNLNEIEEGKQVLEMLHMIRDDDFWKAQIAQLDIDSKARINIFPQIGNERIEFGKPENLEVKFKKLRIFYKEILPQQGWNKYERVNLEYEGQIIAE
jgi:cell division protein FtsQ